MWVIIWRKRRARMDSIYIRKVLSGDTDAFRFFVNNYKDFGFSLSYSIVKNKYIAEECVQEAFIKSFEKLKSFKQDSKFKTWFGRIVINESLKKVEAGNREFFSVDEISDVEIQLVEDTLKLIVKKEQRLYITSVFELLSPKESLVLELFYLKEYSMNEIAENTGWSMSKIKMLLLRGRKSFYAKLSEMLKTDVKEILT